MRLHTRKGDYRSPIGVSSIRLRKVLFTTKIFIRIDTKYVDVIRRGVCGIKSILNLY